MTFLGRAGNEALELIVGDFLIAIGGVLLGLVFTTSNQLDWLIPIFIFFFVFGAIFDIRALNKFRYDLGEIKKDVDSARTDLGITVNELVRTKEDLQDTKDEFEQVKTELEKAKSDLEDFQRALRYDKNMKDF